MSSCEPNRSTTGSRSPGTINQAINTLKSFFRWLTVKDYISRNPTLPIIEQVKDTPKPQKDLSEPEFNALFEALSYRGESEVCNRTIMHVLDHGLRASEISALNVQDYNGKRLDIIGAK